MKTIMLRLFLLLATLGGVSSSLTAFALKDPIFERAEQQAPVKRYIDQKNVFFDKNEIYVQVEQNWIRTDAIFTDENGIYFTDDGYGWECPRCKCWNTANLYKCECCDRIRP